jgi:hypothetical protein
MGNRIITFIFGVGLGVAGTYFYFKRKIDILVSEKVTEELRREFDNKVDVEVIPDEELTPMPDSLIPEKKDIESKEINTHKVAYQKATEMYKEDPEFMTKEEYKEEFPDPVIITEQEHENGADEYDTICCTYNYEDDTLIEDNGGYIEDIDYTVGYINLDVYRDNMTDYIYVRNEYLKTDYCIELDYESNHLY